MLEAMGLGSAEELFDSIPEDLRLKRPLNTPAPLSEIELLDRFEQMGARNAGARHISFMGAVASMPNPAVTRASGQDGSKVEQAMRGMMIAS